MSDGTNASGASDLTRSIWFRDSSRNAEGEDAELGQRRGLLVVGVIDAVDEKTGRITQSRHAYLQPRNWHLSEGDPFTKDFPEVLDARLSVALIADHEHDFPGFHIIEPEDNDSSPYDNDWDFSQKSTRIVDYKDPGKTALFAALCKVVDDHLQQYTAAIPMSRQLGEHESIGAGYLWDADLDQNGLMDTVFVFNKADVYGEGRDGTPYGIAGIRTDAHFELVTVAPPGAGGDKHGAIHFLDVDVSGYQEMPSVGAKYKASLGHDKSQANKNSGIGKEAIHWRPIYAIPNICNETPPYDGPVGYPGTPASAGALISLQPCTSSSPPPSPATFCSIRTTSSGGTNQIEVSQPDGSWTPVTGGGGGGTPASPCHYGDGSDGTFTYDGSSTPTWATYDAPTKTYKLSRDVCHLALTVPNGYTLHTNGYRCLSQTATIDAGGVVSCDGDAAVLSAGASQTHFGSVGRGSFGANGGGAGSNGNNAGSGFSNSLGGGGGTGGGAGGFTGGTPGTVVAPSDSLGTGRAMPFALGFLIGGNLTVSPTAIMGGAGGSGGAAGTGGTNFGGGGGAGGGVCIFTAKTLTNNGRISARGGAGADGNGSSSNQAGGGGGGGGGYLLVSYGTKFGAGTMDANGGGGGVGKSGGSAGTAGTNGTVVALC